MNNVWTVEELFSGRVFQVPNYQRGYAWGERQWRDFRTDLELLPEGSHHYTGTVVLHQRKETFLDDGGGGHTLFHVVDGQQRLTTIVLLLDAIRFFAEKEGPSPTLALGIRKAFVEFRDLNGQPSYKLRLNDDSQEYFIHNVLAEPGGPQGPTIASHQRLKEAKNYFRSYLAESVASQKNKAATWLLTLYKKVVQQLKISLYLVESTSEVGVIFEVMNNRGKQLSELEKVKNYLLYLSSKLQLKEPHDLEERINGTWTEIFQRLMANGLTSADDEDRLLRAHWLTFKDPDAKGYLRSDSIKENYNLRAYAGKHKDLFNDLIDYTTTLKDAVLPFCEAFRPDSSTAFSVWPEKDRAPVKRAAEKLRRMGLIAPFLPLLVAVRLKCPSEHAKYLQLLEICERFAFRVYTLEERRADAGQAKLYRLGHEFYTGEVSFDATLTAIRHRTLHLSSNETLRNGFALNETDNDWYTWKGLKYFLYEYEEHLATNHGLKVSWDAINDADLQRTIEHILPQTPTDKCWKQVFPLGKRRRLTHDIGNLCLSEDNSAYGNKCFPEKKGEAGKGKCYANSNLYQERELAQLKDWNEAALLKRREAITGWALQRWYLTDSDYEEIQELEVEQAAEDEKGQGVIE